MQCTCAILSFVACLTCHIFLPFLVNDTIFEKNIIEHKKYVWIFSINFV